MRSESSESLPLFIATCCNKLNAMQINHTCLPCHTLRACMTHNQVMALIMKSRHDIWWEVISHIDKIKWGYVLFGEKSIIKCLDECIEVVTWQLASHDICARIIVCCNAICHSDEWRDKSGWVLSVVVTQDGSLGLWYCWNNLVNSNQGSNPNVLPLVCVIDLISCVNPSSTLRETE